MNTNVPAGVGHPPLDTQLHMATKRHAAAQFILQPQYTHNPKNICKVMLALRA